MTETRPRTIGAADGWRVGYDLDHTPVVWREGEAAEPADERGDYGGWYPAWSGWEVCWTDPRGRLHRPDGSIT